MKMYIFKAQLYGFLPLKPQADTVNQGEQKEKN